MGGTLAGSVARVAGGFGIVACAAVIGFAAGGTSLFGGLGAVFGREGKSLEVARRAAPSADIVAAPTAGQRAPVRATARLEAAPGPRRIGSRTPGGRPRPGTAPARPGPSQPAPVQVPTPPPLQPPPPSPAPNGGQVVTTVGETAKQVVQQAPPQVQPIAQPISDAVDTLEQTCRGLPVCP